jgi:hypothetical protein|tara:strand:- start:845 stop:1324 length:480 start_codon:yes stop_codon:yes gene_type:complete
MILRCINRKQGRINEKKVLNYLNRNNDINDYWIDNNITNDRSIIDFIHNEKKIKIELKSRNFNVDSFDDWQIGLNKIQEMIDDKDYTYFVFFLFYDGLYYWKYNLPNLINHCSCKEGGTTKRGTDETTTNSVYIKKEHLLHITNKVINIPLDDDEGCLL